MLDILEDLDPVNAVIVAVLNDERWYGDDPPHWIISAGKPSQRASQTAAQASQQRKQTEKLLHRHGSKQSHVFPLARKIDSCRPNRRCGSGACPECTRALQRWFVENAHKAAANLLDTTELILVSLVPDYAATDAMSPMMSWENVIARLCQDMVGVGIPWGIGGSDFSVNIDKVNGGAPILQGQFWMLIEKPKGNWEGQLKALINSSGAIKRPVKKPKYTGSHAQLAYGIKNEFVKRESYIKNTNPDRNQHLNTREKRLRGIPWLKLMLFLDRIGLEGRLIDHNAIHFNAKGWLQVTLGATPNTNKMKLSRIGQKV